MSEIVFLDNEPNQDGATPQQQPVQPVVKKESVKPKDIKSKDYADIKPFFESRYGNSRLFTARSNGQKVILKALKADRANDAQCRASLRSEYDMTVGIDSRFVRKALDFTNIEGLGDCIIFEFVEGKSLAEHVRVGTLSEKQVKSILVDVCDGLSRLHRNQLVHCNLAPENILITETECRAKLIDLGIPETDPDADRELLIKEMEFVAPEIIKGESFDPRADIYSLGKIMEFIGERNISRQFLSVATHCTQFSKEQRYDSIAEVKSAISKGHSLLKVVIWLLVIGLVCGLAFLYVPKIKANIEKERAERMSVDFAHEVAAMQNELPALCEKYRLKSLDEPVAVNWAEDSLRFAQKLMPFFGAEDYLAQSMEALNEQKNHIESSRQKDFDLLLLDNFMGANDSLAVALKAAVPVMTDSAFLVEAGKWYKQRK